MNWKKENYNLGDIVYITTEFMFGNNVDAQEGLVIHVGRSILKVKLEDETILEFRSRTCYNKGLWSKYHTIYKSEEEYKETIAKKHTRECLIKNLTSRLRELSLEDLEAVDVLINKKD